MGITLKYSPSEVLHRWLVLIGMHFSFGLFLGSTLWVSIGLPPWLAPSEVLLGGWIFWIFPLGSSMPPCDHFLVWIVVLLFLYYVAHKLNSVRNERLHIWKTSLLCWIILGETLLRQIFFLVLSWVCMYYGICSVPFLVRCTSFLLRVAPMMRVRLAYYELLIVYQVGLTVCGCNQILQICKYRLIGEE